MNLEINCKHCGRYLFTASSTTVVEQMPCPNTKCKAKLNIKVVTSRSLLSDIDHRFGSNEVAPKARQLSQEAEQLLES